MNKALAPTKATVSSTLLVAGVLAVSCSVREPRDSGVSSAPPSEGTDDEPASAGEEGDDPTTLAAGEEPPPNEAATALLAEVRRELAAVKRSSYVHHTNVDEPTGTFDYDCSGFVSYALSRAAPSAFEQLRRATVARPLARHFVAFLASLNAEGAGRWRRVNRVRDLLPGDVIAWLKPADSISRNTGHVMIVHAPIRPDAGQAGAFVVPIADSTSLLHRPGDSRSATSASGLGVGEIVLLTDEAGAPVQFRWSRGARSRIRATTIALGRLE